MELRRKPKASPSFDSAGEGLESHGGGAGALTGLQTACWLSHTRTRTQMRNFESIDTYGPKWMDIPLSLMEKTKIMKSESCSINV